MESLVKAFSMVDLQLELLRTPINSSNDDIFQMDIGRKLKRNTRDEFFRIWRGHESNVVQVQGSDKQLHQLILFVHEPARTFQETMQKRFLPKGRSFKVISSTEKTVTIERKTSAAKRHFLCGLDERQLFIAQLRQPCSTVRDAHRSLGSSVTFAEGRASGRTQRQGEWFFLNVTPEEKMMINEAIRANRAAVLKRVSIGSMTNGSAATRLRPSEPGNPHVADEAIALTGTPLGHGFTVRTRREVFVRGAVRHKDHQTLKFKHWRKVIRNNEGAGDASFGPRGIFWID